MILIQGIFISSSSRSNLENRCSANLVFLKDCSQSCKYWVAGSTELFDGLQCIVSKKYIIPRKTIWQIEHTDIYLVYKLNKTNLYQGRFVNSIKTKKRIFTVINIFIAERQYSIKDDFPIVLFLK